MIIYPNTVKRQGSVHTGIITLVIAIVIAALGAGIAIFMYSRNNSFYFIPIAFASFLSLGGLIMGTIDLIKGIQGHKIMRDGYKSSCEIVYIGHHSGHSNDRTGPYMIVQYNSQTNKQRLLKVGLNFKNVFRLSLGAVIECYILGEGCYINMKEEVKILKQPEKEMTIKDAFTSLFKDTR